MSSPSRALIDVVLVAVVALTVIVSAPLPERTLTNSIRLLLRRRQERRIVVAVANDRRGKPSQFGRRATVGSTGGRRGQHEIERRVDADRGHIRGRRARVVHIERIDGARPGGIEFTRDEDVAQDVVERAVERGIEIGRLVADRDGVAAAVAGNVVIGARERG